MRVKLKLFSLILIGIVFISILTFNFYSVLAKYPFKTNPSQTRADVWIEDLQANYRNPGWFYTNLNTTDRLMIRQAIDYAIPRTAIINIIMNGFGSPLATYQLPIAGNFYNSSLNIHQYNLTKSKELLTKVFGYTWSPSDNHTTPYNESAFYFPLTLTISTANQEEVQLAYFINGILKSIGIGMIIVKFGDKLLNTILFKSPPATQGFSYAKGGFDGALVRFNGSLLPDDGSKWFGSFYIPTNNYQTVNRTLIDYLTKEENNYSLTNVQREYFYKEMQQYVFNQSLAYILYQNKAPIIYNKYLQGFNSYYAMTGGLPYQNLSFSNNQDHLGIDLSGKWNNLNPLLANDVNSRYYTSQMWAGGLLRVADRGNDGKKVNLTLYGNIAYNNYTISPNGLFYNFTIKPGVRWADGTPITATDVAFTYQSIINKSRNTVDYDLFSQYLTNKSIIVYDNFHIGFNLTKLTTPYPLAEKLFAITILPKSTYSIISNWRTDKTNTGIGLTAQAYNSNGPYQLSYINHSTGALTLKNSSWWSTVYTSKFTAPAFNVSPKISIINIQVSRSASSSLFDLKSNNVDWVDQQVGLKSIYNQILPLVQSGNISESNITLPSWVEFGLNQASPIWGFSPENIEYGPIISSQSTQTVFTPTSASMNSSLFPNFLVIGMGLIIIVVLIYSVAKYNGNKKRNTNTSLNKQKSLCITCGATISTADNFCSNCGKRI